MNVLFLGFLLLMVFVIGATAALMWHWKKYMPESSRGAGIFTIYMVGLAVLIMALFTNISNL
jgi:hypothetical protein